jgi:adenosylmethionine-8-amino-7-oxononanoate aminotransferase
MRISDELDACLSLPHRILDACAGAAVASIGHGDPRVISKIAEQLSTLSYHHTSRLTNPVGITEPVAQLTFLLIFLYPAGC